MAKGIKKEKIEALKKKAVRLYGTGLSMREVADKLGKTHTWVWFAIQETLQKLDKGS